MTNKLYVLAHIIVIINNAIYYGIITGWKNISRR